MRRSSRQARTGGGRVRARLVHMPEGRLTLSLLAGGRTRGGDRRARLGGIVRNLGGLRDDADDGLVGVRVCDVGQGGEEAGGAEEHRGTGRQQQHTTLSTLGTYGSAAPHCP